EPPFNEVRALVISVCGAGGDGLSTSANALQAGDLHQPRDLVATDVPSCVAHCVPHLPDPIDAVVRLMNPLHLLRQHLVPNAASGGRPVLGSAVSAGGDEPTFCRTEDAADGLDPELLAMHVD